MSNSPPIVPKFTHPEEVPAALDSAIDSLKDYGLTNLARHLSQARDNARAAPSTQRLLVDVIETTRGHVVDGVRLLDISGETQWATGLGRILPLLDGAIVRIQRHRKVVELEARRRA